MYVGYSEGSIIDGVQEVRLKSWHHFHDFIRVEYLDYPHYVWRGQRDATWPLQSTLDREFSYLKPKSPRSAAARHLERFKLATRGRRGPNPSKELSEDEWWALAQHNAMSTPLLDWTESPFVALYFAFVKAEAPISGQRAVWVIGGVTKQNKKIIADHVGSDPPILSYIRPQQDENARLVSQAGLFTRVPLGQTVEEWVCKNNLGVTDFVNLAKIIIPDLERDECLRALNRMNINHLSLFPDLYGAGKHCNNRLHIAKY
jgi:hypothetical protein